MPLLMVAHAFQEGLEFNTYVSRFTEKKIDIYS